MKIKAVKAYKILNSNATPTIAVAVKTKKGIFVSGAPAGASVGKHEAEDYRRDVDTDVKYFNSKIKSKLVGFKFKKFEHFEKLEKKLMNAYAASKIALEYSLLKALAKEKAKEIYELINPNPTFPIPLGKVIGGGSHASAGDVQEYLFAPKAKTFTEATFINASLHSEIANKLKKLDKKFQGGKDAEGGWITTLPVTNILELCNKVRGRAELGIDLAATQLYKNRKYIWNNKKFNKLQQLNFLSKLIKDYNLDYIEDPFEENDFSSFANLTGKTDKLICADDLTCTNPNLLREVVKRRAATAVIVKPNQIGSLVKTKEFVDIAKGFNMKIIISHRSGSTEDIVLSHLALAWADYFKCGIAGGERTAKINELIRLENSVNA